MKRVSTVGDCGAFCMGRGEGLSRANLYKMHKGVFGENVQNSKINPPNT